MRAGVKGYVLKHQAANDLVHAIHQVCRGGVYLSPSISRAVVEAYLSKTELPSDRLSSRERHVLQLVGEGKSTNEDAALLVVRVKTAESQRSMGMHEPETHLSA